MVGVCVVDVLCGDIFMVVFDVDGVVWMMGLNV